MTSAWLLPFLLGMVVGLVLAIVLFSFGPRLD
jgi:hypothetical protein